MAGIGVGSKNIDQQDGRALILQHIVLIMIGLPLIRATAPVWHRLTSRLGRQALPPWGEGVCSPSPAAQHTLRRRRQGPLTAFNARGCK